MNLRHLSLLCLGAMLLTAGEPQPWAWPKVVQIAVEEVKPGKEPAHLQNEYAWSKAYADAKSPYHFLGMIPVAGGSQAWWVWPLASYADMEKLNAFTETTPGLKAKVDAFITKDGEFISNFSVAYYNLRPDLSRGPGAIAARYYWIFTERVRPGREGDFETLCKTMNGFYDKAGLTSRWGVYQAMAGTYNPTFLVVLPLHSLADLDAMLADEKKFGQAAGEEGLKALSKLTADFTGKEDSVILAVVPKLSYPDADDLAMDPDFWKDWAPKAKKPQAK